METATRLIIPNAYRGRNLCAVRCSPLFKFRVFRGFVQEGQKLEIIAGKWRFWGRKAPTDRFPAQIFIVLPSRRPVAAIIGNIRGITRFFARNSSFSFAVAPPHIHFYRISEFERLRSPSRRLRRVMVERLVRIFLLAVRLFHRSQARAEIGLCPHHPPASLGIFILIANVRAHRTAHMHSSG